MASDEPACLNISWFSECDRSRDCRIAIDGRLAPSGVGSSDDRAGADATEAVRKSPTGRFRGKSAEAGADLSIASRGAETAGRVLGSTGDNGRSCIGLRFHSSWLAPELLEIELADGD